MKYECRICKASFETHSPQCPKCGKWNALIDPLASASIHGAVASTSTEIIPAIPQIVSGVAPWDSSLAGGYVRDTSVLIAGNPGVGKSTVVLQAGHGYAKNHGMRVLYASAEEDLTPVRARADRLGCVHPNLHFLCSFGLPLERALKEAEKYDLAIYDSLQAFGALITHFRVPNSRIIVSQLNGEGSIKGHTSSEYLCDALIFARDIEAEEEGDPDYFSLQVVKNRNGSTLIRGTYVLTEKGAVAYAPPSKKKAKAIKKAKKDEGES
jgi:DNA repair protein RadA/Sms